MARQRPTTPEAFRNVSGVGERKLEMFGEAFLKEIVGYVMGKVEAGEKPKGSTQLQTYELFQQGLSIEQIAQQRTLGAASITNHLIQLAQAGYPIELESLITPTERADIEAAIEAVGSTAAMRPIFDQLEGQYDYGKISLTIALWKD
jgi:ATP-dependent DNA helicase RecQ